MRKTVKNNGYDFDALIDTGSTITLIREESVHQILGRPTLNPTKINLTSFGLLTLDFLFRCGQLIFRMADCEVEGTIVSPLASPREGNVPDGKERRSKEHQNPDRIRWDRKRGRRASAKQ
ncbi:hypothetical protein TNCV_2821201 [Trichonephila clavipes]|nr:hypothetical protein TNCV_2821201 [Trichonephila clavipes]